MMNQKKRSPKGWEEQANKAAKFFEIPAPELKREIKRALTRIVAERIAQKEISERQKARSTGGGARAFAYSRNPLSEGLMQRRVSLCKS
jgi:hypothetical protein